MIRNLRTSFVSVPALAGTITLVLAVVLCQPLAAETAAAVAQPPGPALVRIELDRALDALGVPVLAHLQDAAGHEYALALVPTAEATAAGLSFQVLDTETSGATYLTALERRPGARRQAAAAFQVLLDDGLRLLVRTEPDRAEELAMLGFDLKALPTEPIALTALVPQLPETITHDPAVETMINEVTQAELWDLSGDLTGVNSVFVSGVPYTITTRNTGSGEPVTKAYTLAKEWLESFGYNTWLQWWSQNGYSCRNVVGEKVGKVLPDEMVLITAHIDNMPSSGNAPGADDNGSGSVALMLASKIMSSRNFERTIRFVFFTGEEQGLYGSAAYANIAKLNGDNIVAVLNLDMVGWDGSGGPVLRLHTRLSSNPGYAADLAIANTFIDVVSTYSLGSVLTPVLDADGEWASDHSRFWDQGFAAVLAIEDDQSDFCPFYHSSSDTRANLNMTYFTNYVKATVGTVSHLAVRTDVPVELQSFSVE